MGTGVIFCLLGVSAGWAGLCWRTNDEGILRSGFLNLAFGIGKMVDAKEGDELTN